MELNTSLMWTVNLYKAHVQSDISLVRILSFVKLYFFLCIYLKRGAGLLLPQLRNNSSVEHSVMIRQQIVHLCVKVHFDQFPNLRAGPARRGRSHAHANPTQRGFVSHLLLLTFPLFTAHCRDTPFDSAAHT